MSSIYKNGIDLRNYVDFTDQNTLKFLASAVFLTLVFQLNSNVSASFLKKYFKPIINQKNLTRKIIVQRLADITTMIRPACMNSGVPERYYKRMMGEKCDLLINEKNHFVTMLKKHTEKTFYEILYQEQIMKILSDLFNISFGKADDYRRAFEKNDLEKINKLKKEYWNIYKDKVSIEDLKEFWQYLIDSSGYLFNESHAVAYSLNTFYTAYIKKNPKIALSVGFNIFFDKTDKLREYMKECVQLNIKVNPPKFNHNYDIVFPSKNSNEIYLSIKSINNIGQAVSTALSGKNNFENLDSFLTYCANHEKINKGVIERLIKLNYFSDITTMSKKELWEYVNNFKIYLIEEREKKFIKKYKDYTYTLKKGEIFEKDLEGNKLLVKVVKNPFNLNPFEQKYSDKWDNFLTEKELLNYPITHLEDICKVDLEENDKLLVINKIDNRTNQNGYKYCLISDGSQNHFCGGTHYSFPSNTVVKATFIETKKGVQIKNLTAVDYIN